MELPQRKPNRLPNFDYSTPGAYFITICAKDHKCIFGHIVGGRRFRILCQPSNAFATRMQECSFFSAPTMTM